MGNIGDQIHLEPFVSYPFHHFPGECSSQKEPGEEDKGGRYKKKNEHDGFFKTDGILSVCGNTEMTGEKKSQQGSASDEKSLGDGDPRKKGVFTLMALVH
jgi:hypothetical protein